MTPVESGPPAAAEQVRARAEAFIRTLEEAGAPVARAQLDYTPASLEALDELLGEFHMHGAEAPAEVIAGAGCYVLEVARAEHGGVFQAFDDDDDDPLVLVVQHEAGQVGLLATSKVKGRVVNGPEDNLPFFYAGFTQAIRDRRSATIT